MRSPSQPQLSGHGSTSPQYNTRRPVASLLPRRCRRWRSATADQVCSKTQRRPAQFAGPIWFQIGPSMHCAWKRGYLIGLKIQRLCWVPGFCAPFWRWGHPKPAGGRRSFRSTIRGDVKMGPPPQPKPQPCSRIGRVCSIFLRKDFVVRRRRFSKALPHPAPRRWRSATAVQVRGGRFGRHTGIDRPAGDDECLAWDCGR
jgi:hypothetical protein